MLAEGAAAVFVENFDAAAGGYFPDAA